MDSAFNIKKQTGFYRIILDTHPFYPDLNLVKYNYKN